MDAVITNTPKRARFLLLLNQHRTKGGLSNPEFRELWHLYMASPEWGTRRRKVRERSKGICENCRVRKATDCHHMTYQNRFCEPIEDLLDVCRTCHELLGGRIAFNPTENESMAETTSLSYYVNELLREPQMGGKPNMERTYNCYPDARPYLKNIKKIIDDHLLIALDHAPLEMCDNLREAAKKDLNKLPHIFAMWYGSDALEKIYEAVNEESKKILDVLPDRKRTKYSAFADYCFLAIMDAVCLKHGFPVRTTQNQFCRFRTNIWGKRGYTKKAPEIQEQEQGQEKEKQERAAKPPQTPQVSKTVKTQLSEVERYERFLKFKALRQMDPSLTAQGMKEYEEFCKDYSQ